METKNILNLLTEAKTKIISKTKTKCTVETIITEKIKKTNTNWN